MQAITPYCLTPALLLQAAPQRLLHLSGVDLAIVVLYFVAVLSIGFYLKKYTLTGEDFFLAGPGNDRLGGRLELPRPPTSARSN